MKVLGIDTSTSCGGVGLVDEGGVISEYLLDVPLTHSERLLCAIEHVLKEADCPLEALDGWAISLGPGSFTGLRIGVSAVKGLALASRKPVAGIPTLDGLAAQISPTPYVIRPILDARKGELYTASYRYSRNDHPVRVSDYRAMGPEALIRDVNEKTIFVGNGGKLYEENFRKALPALALFPADPLHLLHGSTVAKLGLALLKKKEYLDLSSFVPIYVRASEAEIKWQERLGAPPCGPEKTSPDLE